MQFKVSLSHQPEAIAKSHNPSLPFSKFLIQKERTGGEKCKTDYDWIVDAMEKGNAGRRSEFE